MKYGGHTVDMGTVLEILRRAYDPEYAREACGPAAWDPDAEALHVAAQLISSDIDVDRADYILRDSYYAGSVEGLYDLNRLYAVAVLVPPLVVREKEEARCPWLRVGVIDKGVSVAENMLLARVYMYSDVYLHTISMIYGGMAARLVALIHNLPESVAGVFPGGSCLKRLVRRELGDEEILDCVTRLTDSTFRMIVREAGDVIQRILESREHLEALQASMGSGVRACKTLLAIRLLANALLYRRHWSAYVLEGRLAGEIVDEIRRGSINYINTVARNIDPLVVFSTSLYKVAGEQSVIPVYLRSLRLVVPLHKSSSAVVAQSLAGKRYAKIVIAFPRLHSPAGDAGSSPAHWSFRPSKPVLEDAIRGMEGPCRRLDPEAGGRLRDYITDAMEEARRLAEELSRLASQRIPP